MIGMTRSSSLPSLCEKDFLELVWENGQILERGGGSLSNTHHEGRRTRLSRVYSVLDDEFPPHHRDSDLMMMRSSHQSSDQHSCQIDDLHFPPIGKNSLSMLHQEHFANSSRSPSSSSAKESKINNNNNLLCTYSTPSQQCLPTFSSPPKKPRVDHCSTQAAKKPNTQNLGCDINQRTTRKVNFSNFLIPALCLKSSHLQGNIANQQTRNNNNASSSCSARVEEINEAGKVDKTPPAATNHNNNSALRLQVQGSHPVPYYNKTSSSAASKAKGIANNNNNDDEFCNDPLLASSSVCSLEASNDPKISVTKHVHEYTTDDSTYFSDNDEETEDVVKETPPRDLTRVKRCRNPEIHNLSERKRRDNINKKIRTLKELIPNCNKMDKASTLDDAIDYLKTLKLQLQIMSMGSGLCNPVMMLPLMGAAGMCLRPAAGGTGFPCNPTAPQFPIPPLSAVTDTTLLSMFGFSNHMRLMPPMPHPHAPNFIPNNNSNMNAMKSPTPPIMPAAAAITNHLVGNLANPADLHANAEFAAAMQATSNQVSIHHNNSVYPFYFPTGKDQENRNLGQDGKTRIM